MAAGAVWVSIMHVASRQGAGRLRQLGDAGFGGGLWFGSIGLIAAVQLQCVLHMCCCCCMWLAALPRVELLLLLLLLVSQACKQTDQTAVVGVTFP